MVESVFPLAVAVAVYLSLKFVEDGPDRVPLGVVERLDLEGTAFVEEDREPAELRVLGREVSELDHGHLGSRGNGKRGGREDKGQED